jgi:hypothetical protein
MIRTWKLDLLCFHILPFHALFATELARGHSSVHRQGCTDDVS